MDGSPPPSSSLLPEGWNPNLGLVTPVSFGARTVSPIVSETVGELVGVRQEKQKRLFREVADDVEALLAKRFKQDRRGARHLLPSVVADSYLQRGGGLSNSSASLSSSADKSVGNNKVIDLEKAVGTQRAKAAPELVTKQMTEKETRTMRMVDNFTPNAHMVRMRLRTDGPNTKCAENGTSGQLATSFLPIKVTRDWLGGDNSTFVFDGEQAYQPRSGYDLGLDSQRTGERDCKGVIFTETPPPAGRPFTKDAVAEVTDIFNDDRWFKLGPGGTLPRSPLSSRLNAIDRGDAAWSHGVRPGDLRGAQQAAERDWEKDIVVHSREAILGSNVQDCRSSDHVKYRRVVIGSLVRDHLPALREGNITLFEVVDTEFVNHLAKLWAAIDMRSEVVSEDTAELVWHHLVQLPMCMHFEKAIQEDLYCSPLALLVCLGAHMGEDYKKSSAKMAKVVKDLREMVDALPKGTRTVEDVIEQVC